MATKLTKNEKWNLLEDRPINEKERLFDEKIDKMFADNVDHKIIKEAIIKGPYNDEY